MRERPILFSGPMIRAILDGRKVQTRRLYKPREGSPYEIMGELPDGKPWPHGFDPNKGPEFHPLACPYGQPGDRLWVRETFGLTREYDDDGDPTNARGVLDATGERHWVVYRADHLDWVWTDGDGYSGPSCWKPSIYMPRWASRITLEVTNVRVERLQSISEADARSEGLSAITKDGTLVKYGIPDRDGLPGTDNDGWPWVDWNADPRNAFQRLWESINGAESWDANRWVWVVEFRRLEVTK